jgi:hypothetical protein
MMKTKSILKHRHSPSYKNYEREVYMSEYVTIPKARPSPHMITEGVAWGISAFILLVYFN